MKERFESTSIIGFGVAYRADQVNKYVAESEAALAAKNAEITRLTQQVAQVLLREQQRVNELESNYGAALAAKDAQNRLLSATLQALVAAGHVSPEKVDEACDLMRRALERSPFHASPQSHAHQEPKP